MATSEDAASKTAKWISYVTVADVDAAVKLAGELGGAVQTAATDLGQYGRFALLKDNMGSLVAVHSKPPAPPVADTTKSSSPKRGGRKSSRSKKSKTSSSKKSKTHE